MHRRVRLLANMLTDQAHSTAGRETTHLRGHFFALQHTLSAHSTQSLPARDGVQGGSLTTNGPSGCGSPTAAGAPVTSSEQWRGPADEGSPNTSAIGRPASAEPLGSSTTDEIIPSAAGTDVATSEDASYCVNVMETGISVCSRLDVFDLSTCCACTREAKHTSTGETQTPRMVVTNKNSTHTRTAAGNNQH